MKVLSDMCRFILRQKRLLAVFIILYLLAGAYVSFADFHYVHLNWIAGIDYQAQF